MCVFHVMFICVLGAPGITSGAAALRWCSGASVAGEAGTHSLPDTPPVSYVSTKHTKLTHASPSFPLFLPLPLHRGAHRDGGHGTSYSEKYYDGDRPAAMHNKNVEWLRYAHFWWLYLGFVAFFVTLLRLTVLSKAEDLGMVLTVTHVVHNLVSTQGERGRDREAEEGGRSEKEEEDDIKKSPGKYRL